VVQDSSAELYGTNSPHPPQRSFQQQPSQGRKDLRFSDADYSKDAALPPNFHQQPSAHYKRRESFLERQRADKPSYWSKRISKILPIPKNSANFTQTYIPANPKTSQVRLKELTFIGLHNFTKAMEKVHGNHLQEELLIG
jgi:hypothetical protein